MIHACDALASDDMHLQLDNITKDGQRGLEKCWMPAEDCHGVTGLMLTRLTIEGRCPESFCVEGSRKAEAEAGTELAVERPHASEMAPGKVVAWLSCDACSNEHRRTLCPHTGNCD